MGDRMRWSAGWRYQSIDDSGRRTSHDRINRRRSDPGHASPPTRPSSAEADAPPLLFHHSRRVYLFGTLQGRRRGLSPDPELLYVGAMRHDLGLTEKYRTQRPALRDRRRRPGARRSCAATAIGAREARRIGPLSRCTRRPASPSTRARDRAGHGRRRDRRARHRLDELDSADICAVGAAHPRPDFKRQILAAFTNGFSDRHDTTFGTVNADVLEHFSPGLRRTDFVEVIESSSWPE